MAKNSSIQERIARVGEKLTPTERRIAQEVVRDPTMLAFGTVSDLATRIQTSRPTIVRFATKLGFDGYTDLQQWARDGLANQLSSPSQRIRQQHGELAPARMAIAGAIEQTLATLDNARLEALAAPIMTAPRVWIVSGETSRAGAYVLHSGLAMVRGGVILVKEHNLGRDLSDAMPGDAAVVFDFARYRRSSVTAAKAFDQLGVSIVAITDGPLSPIAAMTNTWCELAIPAVGPFDTSLPAVAAAELLVAEVVCQLGNAATTRIDRLEELWNSTDTFLPNQTRSDRER